FGEGDKLFAPLAGRPLIAHTLMAFEVCRAVDTVVLVLAEENLERGCQLVDAAGFDKVAVVCPGGARRQDSVRLGLEALPECRWVVVHDGARPLVTAALIEAGLAAAAETGAAIAAVPLVDTLKEAAEDGLVTRTLDRRNLWAAQTPQVFDGELLREAHRQTEGEVTDDAALVETLGRRVKVFPGSPRNLKVTTAADLALAQALVAEGGKG
ncbi:MAG TPA: 2-C-methyl-D-erythritol 4-phosphate cytidylyltransferase, partial [Dehalococcoidia bacterium]|nr:2-C-methyl-D-erythritol 4-phosphate cytidylyltransferase [Dehalococcoidia bacterium]